MKSLVVVMLLLSTSVLAQQRPFGGSGKPPIYPEGMEPLVSRPPGAVANAPLDLNVLFRSLMNQRSYQVTTPGSGAQVNLTGMSLEDRAFFNNTDPSSAAYAAKKHEVLSRFLNSYQSDLQSGNHGGRVELMKEFGQTNKMDVSFTAVEASKPQLKNLSVASQTGKMVMQNAAKKLGRMPRGTGFAFVDGLLVASSFYKASVDQEMENDILNGVCRENPDDQYVQMVMLADQNTLTKILQNCPDTDKTNPKSLGARIAAKRAKSREQFSRGQTKCSFDSDGNGHIESLSESGTKQILKFNKNRSQNLDTLTILPQKDKYHGSFLVYSGFPADPKVSYTAIAPKNRREPDFNTPQVANEPLTSYAARVECDLRGCEDDVFQKIWGYESLSDVQPSKPFGQLQPNSDFFESAAKTLGHFRQGLEQNADMPKTFKTVCIYLGGKAPKEPISNDKKTPKVPVDSSSTEGRR